jgi:hypothetical protein
VLHVVWAESGEYSGRAIWTVAAYLERAQAERHVSLAQAWSDAAWQALRDAFDEPEVGFDEEEVLREAAERGNPYDSTGTIDKPRYSLLLLAVHADAERYRALEPVLLDYCKEQGWVP